MAVIKSNAVKVFLKLVEIVSSHKLQASSKNTWGLELETWYLEFE